MSLYYFFNSAPVAPNTVTLGAVAGSAVTSLNVQNTPPPNTVTLGAVAGAATAAFNAQEIPSNTGTLTLVAGAAGIALNVTNSTPSDAATLGLVAQAPTLAFGVQNTPPPRLVSFSLAPSAPTGVFNANNIPPADTLTLGLVAQPGLMGFDAVAVPIAGSFALQSGDAAGSFAVSVTGSNPYDLVTSAYATNALAAGNITLTDAQTAILPTVITACSREVIRFLGRNPNLVNYDEIVTPEGSRQDRGEPASAQLSSFPVQSISRVITGRTAAILIKNTDPITNQFATVAFTVVGDVEYLDLVYTGLTLTSVASGIPATNTITWPTSPPYMTVNALAAAINALGGGWQANVQGSSLGLWPTTELAGVREPKNAFSPGASLDVFSTPAVSYDIDRATGILRLYGLGGYGAWGIGGIGDPMGFSWDGFGDWGTGALGWSQFRVTYSAGWPTVPESLQQVTAELVKLTFDRLRISGALQSQNQIDASWTARQSLEALPDWATQILYMYRDWKV